MDVKQFAKYLASFGAGAGTGYVAGKSVGQDKVSSALSQLVEALQDDPGKVLSTIADVLIKRCDHDLSPDELDGVREGLVIPEVAQAFLELENDRPVVPLDEGLEAAAHKKLAVFTEEFPQLKERLRPFMRLNFCRRRNAVNAYIVNHDPREMDQAFAAIEAKFPESISERMGSGLATMGADWTPVEDLAYGIWKLLNRKRVESKARQIEAAMAQGKKVI